MSSQWLNNVIKILESEEINLRTLASIAGVDPEYFYVGCNLTGVDIRGQNLSGMKFGNANWTGVIADASTVVDGKSFLDTKAAGDYSFKDAELVQELYLYLDEYCRKFMLPYKSHGIRHALNRVRDMLGTDEAQVTRWRSYFSERYNLEFFLAKRRGRRHMTFKISDEEHQYIRWLSRFFPGVSGGYSAVVAIARELEAGRLPK